MSEVDLCDRLREWAERLGFEVFPEVKGWDMVLVLPAGVAPAGLQPPRSRYAPPPIHLVQPGQQVGIHAKLRASCELLAQAMAPARRWRTGTSYPHLPFVAAPRPGEGFCALARRLGIGVIDTDPQARRPRWHGITEADRRRSDPLVKAWPGAEYNALHAAGSLKPLALPPIASRAIRAGAPSPRVLSTWRVSAIRFLAFARAADTWTVADLERHGINRAWADRWGDLVETRPIVRRGRSVRVNIYRLITDASRLPDAGYEDVAAELLAADAARAAGSPS